MIRDMMPNFELLQPTKLADALTLLDRRGKDIWKMAGGNDSLDWFKDRVKRPKVVMDLGGIWSLRVFARPRTAASRSARSRR